MVLFPMTLSFGGPSQFLPRDAVLARCVPLSSTLLSKVKDFPRSQAVSYTGKVVICRKLCYIVMMQQHTTNRKWYSYMANLMAAIVMTMSVLKGHSPIACFFKCSILCLLHVAWFLCICRASCLWGIKPQFWAKFLIKFSNGGLLCNDHSCQVHGFPTQLG